MKIITLDEIKKILQSIELLPAIEQGFIDYSAGRAVVPPVGELLLENGEVHIKYGFIQGDSHYVIKIASGFYSNPALGLPSNNGLMLVFNQVTGELACILLDEGYLTAIRTAAAGAIAARVLAPQKVECIGIVGAGEQARLQLSYLKAVTDCRDVLVWALSDAELIPYQRDMTEEGFSIKPTRQASEILATCNLVVTATPSIVPLLHAADLRLGTHITAVGSDTPHKQELEAGILNRADLVVADSISQCMARGEIYQAINAMQLTQDRPVELGKILTGEVQGRTHEAQITVADLTGVAVQDIKIASLVYQALR